jgi:hypothetical protein
MIYPQVFVKRVSMALELPHSMRNRYYPFAGRGIPADAKCSFDNPTGADTLPSHLKVHAPEARCGCRSALPFPLGAPLPGAPPCIRQAAYRSRLGTGTAVRCGSWQGNAAPGSDVIAAGERNGLVLGFVREIGDQLKTAHRNLVALASVASAMANPRQ